MEFTFEEPVWVTASRAKIRKLEYTLHVKKSGKKALKRLTNCESLKKVLDQILTDMINEAPFQFFKVGTSLMLTDPNNNVNKIFISFRKNLTSEMILAQIERLTQSARFFMITKIILTFTYFQLKEEA